MWNGDFNREQSLLIVFIIVNCCLHDDSWGRDRPVLPIELIAVAAHSIWPPATIKITGTNSYLLGTRRRGLCFVRRRHPSRRTNMSGDGKP